MVSCSTEDCLVSFCSFSSFNRRATEVLNGATGCMHKGLRVAEPKPSPFGRETLRNQMQEARELEGQKVCPIRGRCESACSLIEGPNKETRGFEGPLAPAIDKAIMKASARDVRWLLSSELLRSRLAPAWMTLPRAAKGVTGNASSELTVNSE